MSNKKDNIIKGIQVVLWIALAVSFLCMVAFERKWGGRALIVIAMALGNIYAYKKNPTQKKLKDIVFVVCIVCAVLAVLTFLNP